MKVSELLQESEGRPKDNLARIHILNGLKTKDELLKYILKRLKNEPDNHLYARSLIRAARDLGRNYPEFRAIEKSIGENPNE